MNCEILRTLYIRSNGEIPCNDDLGEKIILGRVNADDPDWDINSVLSNASYSKIRDSFGSGIFPWLDTCQGCAFYRPHEPLSDMLAQRRIVKLQIEPSLACNLRCPCCSNQIQVKTRRNPLLMGLDLFETILKSLKRSSYSIDQIEYCGQGEPLLHPNFPQFARLARDYYPDTRQRLITSGNFDYSRATGGEQIDEIFVSCDGVFQQSYEQYRRRGRVDLAIQFMKDAPKEIGGRRQILVWKYILFEFNDSEEEIYVAQKLAQEIGVDTMLFVFTHSDFRSQRYRAKNAASFPLYFPNVTTNATPVHYQDSDTPDLSLCALDEVRNAGRWLRVRGWALSHQRVSGIRISLDGSLVGYARIGLPRPGIRKLYAGFHEPNGGFDFLGRVSTKLVGRHEIEVELLSERGVIRTVRQICLLN